MKVQLIRHATLLLEIHGQSILVDPMFSQASALDPAANSENQKRNPLVELPKEILDLAKLDAIMVTHLHRDHFDEAAIRILPKHLPIFCQLADQENLHRIGFNQVIPIVDSVSWNEIEITRIRGQHGKNEMAEKMGPVSGFVLKTSQEPILYLTGDTVWCSDLEDALNQYRPDVTIAFAGAAEFRTGGPITMNSEDIVHICETLLGTTVVAVHMEAWNHCLLSRTQLQNELNKHKLLSRVRIPADGEWMEFS